MAEKTIVKLVHGNETREFDIEHAQSLLQYQDKKKTVEKNRWALAANQPFEYKNGVISPTGKGKDKDTGQ